MGRPAFGVGRGDEHPLIGVRGIAVPCKHVSQEAVVNNVSHENVRACLLVFPAWLSCSGRAQSGG